MVEQDDMKTRAKRWCSVSALVALTLLAFASSAQAFKVISEPGEGAGQAREAPGLATDEQTGRLFVADLQNNRIDVFDAEGDFEEAFGWGVKNGAAQLQTCTTASSCRKGLAGAGEGQLSSPKSVAVDNDPASPSFHDLYVYDAANHRVEKFGPEGKFILAFGSAGSGEGQIASFAAFVGVGPGGTVYVLDTVPLTGNQTMLRLKRFDPSGAPITPALSLFEETHNGGGAEGFAVDGSTGDFYVGGFGVLRKYEPTSAVPIGEISISNNRQSLAVDPAGHLFVSEANRSDRAHVSEYDSAGNELRSFGYGRFAKGIPYALAAHHSAGGELYASDYLGGTEGSRIIQLDFPPPGPLFVPSPCGADPLGNTKGILKAEINPEGKATTFHFEAVDDATFQKDLTELGPGHGFDHAKRFPKLAGEDEALPADFALHTVSAEAVLVPSTKYHCRAVASNADGTVGGEEGTFTSLDPLEFGSAWSSDVGPEEATLNAEVNPLGIPTSGYFEYVEESTYLKDISELGPGHGFDHASKAPAEEAIEFGAGESLQAGKATVTGLKAGTSYRWRIVAIDPYFEQGLPGITRSLRTFGAGEGGLPDGRAYELVSPGRKNSADVGVPSDIAGLFDNELHIRIQAAAASGEAATYTSWTSFGQAEGAQGANQYLSKRGTGGWQTENVTPGGLTGPTEVPYMGFTRDLGFGAFFTNEPPLTAEAQTGFRNLYLRNNGTGALQALTIEEPQVAAGSGFCPGYAGASADGSQAIFAGRGAMAGAPAGAGFSLYEWSAKGGLSLVSVFPNEEPAPPVDLPVENPGKGTGFGAMGGSCAMGQGMIRNAISEDGSVVFWRYGGKYQGAERPLFARIDGAETIQLDAKPQENAGKGPFGGGQFWAATGDGEKAFFTAPGKLTKDAEAPGLYRYDLGTRSLLDLTPGKVDPEVEGVIGVSEDGAYAYFVARGVLSEDENANHQKAVAKAKNLYLWHEGEGLRFIASLTELDERDWEAAPARLSARLTPNGHQLAFHSIESEALSGYDNTIEQGGGCQQDPYIVDSPLAGDPHCAEVYLYDAETDSLTCASCNPSGARPAGPAALPVWTNPFEGPHVISADGSKLFFESRDVLNPNDENGKRDVYEFERAGSGTCTDESPAFDPLSGGCHFLISSGKSGDESFLIDASESGRDVFISTRSQLSGWDENENYDIYDAREGGGFPEPSQPQNCEGEACTPPASAPPLPSAPATANFQGPGNPVAKQKKKKHGRKKQKKHSHGSHGRRQGR
jgi:DNA-binding beta-propeller fold protein YncE